MTDSIKDWLDKVMSYDQLSSINHDMCAYGQAAYTMDAEGNIQHIPIRSLYSEDNPPC